MSNGALVQGATVGPLGNGTLGFLNLLVAAAVFVRHLGAHLVEDLQGKLAWRKKT